MEQVFRAEHRDARADGALGPVRLWVRTVAAFLRVAPAAHASGLRQDVAYALRAMRRSPAFTVVALVTLGLGIGAATTMFTVVDAVLLRPLPFDAATDLVAVHEQSLKNPGDARFEVSYPNFLDIRERSRTIGHAAAVRFDEVVVRGGSEPIRQYAAYVSPEMFTALRVTPAVGRTFTPEESRPGGRAVVVGYGLWQRLLGADPRLEGRTLTIGQTPINVVGVMPAGFAFPTADTEIWLPIGTRAADPPMLDRSVHMTSVIARLEPGTTLTQARSELTTLATGLHDVGHTVAIVPLADDLVGPSRQALIAGCAAIGLVLLLACVNTAGLLLARASSRRRETAIRSAIGASRARLVRQHLTESLILGLAGAAVGIAFTAFSLTVVRSTLSEIVPRSDGMTLDGRALAFALAAALVTCLVFGVIPALAGSRGGMAGDLKSGRFAVRRSMRLRGGLVVAEMALSLLLVVGAGLLGKSYWRVLHVDPGFQASGLVTMRVTLPSAHFPDTPSVVRFYRDLPERLERVPGAEAVSGVNAAPISGGDGHGNITVDGREFPAGDAPTASFRRILPNYFRTMQIPVVSGREFDEHDRGQDPLVVIVSQAMARRLWPDANPIGQRIKIGPPAREPWLTIVGIVGDVRNVGLEHDLSFDTYEPHAQRPWTTMQLLVRAQGDASKVGADIRKAARAIDADLIVDRLQTMDARISASQLARRFSTGLISAFAGLALVLAAVSLYGLTAYTVSERTREFGVRMALGAARRDILWLVAGKSLRLGIAGVAIGLLAAVPAAQAARAFLPNVGPHDPIVFLTVGMALFCIALVASSAPAHRATRVDPNIALRVE
jgi:putative ABC transport system permease protein